MRGEREKSVYYGAHYGVIIFSLHMYIVILCVSVYKGIGFEQQHKLMNSYVRRTVTNGPLVHTITK